MKKTEPKKISNTIILTAVVVVVTLFIGVIFIFIPFLSKSKAFRAEILHERDRNVLIGTVRALGKHLKVYEKRLPEGRSVSWLLSQVSDMASGENIEIASIKPGTPEKRGLYTRLYVEMDITSTYHQLGRFMSKIESSEKFLRVERINTKRLDVDTDFQEDDPKVNAFDAKSHIIISMVVLKE
ncbi:MAG: type 4a pilus biogenesis protein PilO [Candidatus Omnitrophica bacterium]|nr:type 4a pilus biogenesis protein PilO [Candidatus Omnitrophota bacterium]